MRYRDVGDVASVLDAHRDAYVVPERHVVNAEGPRGAVVVSRIRPGVVRREPIAHHGLTVAAAGLSRHLEPHEPWDAELEVHAVAGLEHKVRVVAVVDPGRGLGDCVAQLEVLLVPCRIELDVVGPRAPFGDALEPLRRAFGTVRNDNGRGGPRGLVGRRIEPQGGSYLPVRDAERGQGLLVDSVHARDGVHAASASAGLEIRSAVGALREGASKRLSADERLVGKSGHAAIGEQLVEEDSVARDQVDDAVVVLPRDDSASVHDNGTQREQERLNLSVNRKRRVVRTVDGRIDRVHVPLEPSIGVVAEHVGRCRRRYHEIPVRVALVVLRERAAVGHSVAAMPARVPCVPDGPVGKRIPFHRPCVEAENRNMVALMDSHEKVKGHYDLAPVRERGRCVALAELDLILVYETVAVKVLPQHRRVLVVLERLLIGPPELLLVRFVHRPADVLSPEKGGVDAGRRDECERDEPMVLELVERRGFVVREDERAARAAYPLVAAVHCLRAVPVSVANARFVDELAHRRSLARCDVCIPFGVFRDPMTRIVLVHSRAGSAVLLAAELLVLARAAGDIPAREPLRALAALGDPELSVRVAAERGRVHEAVPVPLPDVVAIIAGSNRLL